MDKKTEYTPSERQAAALENNFRYHAPHGDQAKRYEQIRAAARELAATLVELCPESRELSVAMTELESCVMWANASIARNEPNPTKIKGTFNG